MNPKVQYVGMVWYRREDYEKLKSIFTDGHVLPDTFDRWLQLAENSFTKFSIQGITVEKVYIDPETFPGWCKERSFNIDAKARTAFSNDFVARKYLGKNM